MSKEKEKYKCLLCRRVMDSKTPHNCNHGFRKRGLKWEESVVKENLTSEERAREVLIQHNKWRRSDTDEVEMPHPKELGIALDVAISALAELTAYREELKEIVGMCDYLEIEKEQAFLEIRKAKQLLKE